MEWWNWLFSFWDSRILYEGDELFEGKYLVVPNIIITFATKLKIK